MSRIVRLRSLLLSGLVAGGCAMKLPPQSQAAQVADADADAGGQSQSDAGALAVTLPPDPGAAGLATLAGIDSDGDGVRDDVQRFVVLSYPDSQRTQAALLQLAKGYAAWLSVAAQDTNAAYDAEQKSQRAMECVYAVAASDVAYSAINEIKLQVLNTDARQDVFYATDAMLSGGVFETTPDYQSGVTCAFNPQALPN